jgi:hypothetical protein
MNDWRPDWTDESQYKVDDLSNEELAWEFLRRNPDYQRDSERTKITITEENNDPDLDIYYCDDGRKQTIPIALVDHLRRKYFLRPICFIEGDYQYLMLPPHIGRTISSNGLIQQKGMRAYPVAAG